MSKTPRKPLLPRPIEYDELAVSKTKRQSVGKKHVDRFALINGFADFAAAGLTRSEALTWVILWRDSRDGIAITSHSDIARRAGITPRAAITAVGSLLKKGLIRLVKRGGGDRGPNWYQVRCSME